jgi:hypothetical protein
VPTISRAEKRAVIALVILFGLGLGAMVFGWLHLDVARGRSATDVRAQTYRSTSGDAETRAGPGPAVTLHVDAPGQLGQALGREFYAALQATPAFYDLRLAPILPGETESDVVLVEVRERDLLWTPFYARARLTLSVAYASDGDLSWRGADTVEMSNAQGSLTRLEAEVSLTDRAYGLVSYPAYLDRVAHEAAWPAVERIMEQLAQ